MTTPLPKWLMARYSILWKTFNNKEFNYPEAVKTLNEKEKRLTSVILSELKKNGWLTLKVDPKDSRKRIYKLKSPEEAITEMKNRNTIKIYEPKEEQKNFKEMF